MSRVHLTNHGFEVEVMADSLIRIPKSLDPKGYRRATSFRLVMPRIVLAEFNTHRLISRNSASSRAIPATKFRERVKEKPFVPDRFPRDHKGMQASEWVTPEDPKFPLWVANWLDTRNNALKEAEWLSSLGISKQLVNRILEPWFWHEVIATATEWENFLALRAHPDAMNEIRIIAEMIMTALNQSKPAELIPGRWHLPFGDTIDYDRLRVIAMHENLGNISAISRRIDELAVQVTVARCARVSYLNFEGKDDYESDIDLYKRLKAQGHWSPTEHAAMAMSPDQYQSYAHVYPDHTELGWCGNLRGFIQHRRTFPRDVESRPEPRLKILDI